MASFVGRIRERWQTRRGEAGSWALREMSLATISELRGKLESLRPDPELDDPVEQSLRAGVEQQLDCATEKLGHGNHPRHLASAHLTAALVHMNSARSLMLRLADPELVKPLLPGLVALVREHLSAQDPRRLGVEALPAKETLDPADVELLGDAVGVARLEALKEQLRVGSFVRIVGFVTAGLTLAAVAVALLGVFSPGSVPLCFAPQKTPQSQAAQPGPGFNVVCPINDQLHPKSDDPNQAMSDASTSRDYIAVEVIGLVAAGIAAASALRNINGTSTPYNVPVALAVLKLPTGALTAVLGILLMRGGFVPGLSALDNSAQIIAWSLIFGYSQQLFTKFVDQQGQAVLDSVHGPTIHSQASPDPAAKAK
ncbi:hypothetical protein ABT095_25845 [Kitasatospora sp. NPDC002227]|uniref:hypothetical protein n=1 Tax=Kitasatospora sp. NPDC002227 TaxID=3154773 RepID=UPI003329E431